ncbi:hypothetical protein C8R44DRAFT_818992 [Mycena epipterygia]|nr:hypothetical protein C8R44DRAFT_818992 [Mycena epipterygia]
MTAQGYNPITVYLLCVASALCASPLFFAPPPLTVLRLHTRAPALRAPPSPSSFFLSIPHCGDVTPDDPRLWQTPPYLSSPSPCSSFRLRARVHSCT